MSHCTQQKQGNIFNSTLPDHGPYSGSVEKVCKDDDGGRSSYSRQYSSYSSNVKPENPQEVARALENQGASKPGILGNIFKSVFGKSSSSSVSSQSQSQLPSSSSSLQSHPKYNIQEQNWPTPNIEVDDGSDDGNGESDEHRQSGGVRSKQRTTKPVNKQRKSRSIKRRKSSIHRRSIKKRSIKKSRTKRR